MVVYALILVAALTACLAGLVYRAAPNLSVNRRFAIFAMSVSTWIVGIAGVHGTTLAQLWGSLAFCGASLIPPTLLGFVSSYPIPTPQPPRWLLPITVAFGAAFGAVALASDLLIYGAQMTSAGLTRIPGPLYSLFVIYFATTLLISLAMLIFKCKNARGIARVQLHYLTAAVVVGAMGPVATNLLLPFITGQSTYAWVGPFFILAWLALVAHAIIRHRLMDLRLVVHRGLTIAIAITLSLVPVALLLLAIWPKLLIDLDVQERVLLLGATMLTTLLVPITRDFASRLLDHYVYRTHTNYRQTVTRASQILTRELDLVSLLRFISTTVMNSTGVAGVSIYLREQGRLRLAAATSSTEHVNFSSPVDAPQAVVDIMAQAREPVLAEDVAREIPVGHSECVDHLDRLGWFLLLPVQADDGLIGVISLGAKRSGDPFYPQDLDLLMTLANQAAIAVKNAQLYAEAALAHEYIENIVATIESGVVAINASEQITIFNREAERLTGLNANKLKGKPATELPIALSMPLLDGMAGGTKTIPEITLTAALEEGPQKAVICTTSPLIDRSGKVLGAVAVFSDLTPVRELEAARYRAERLAYFELLASGIAHEIKNPLVSIKTYAQLLPRKLHDNRFIEDFGRIADREIGRIEHLLEQLRRLSRPSGRQHQLVDLRLPVKDAIESLQAAFDEKGTSIDARLNDSPIMIVGDHSDLESLFFNLLLNAHEATPAHGLVTVRLTLNNEVGTVTVMDNGLGIPSHLLERIFEPFFSTKARGSGLGLALCAGIAQTHRADLRVANNEGGGAAFSIEFPLASASIRFDGTTMKAAPCTTPRPQGSEASSIQPDPRDQRARESHDETT